MVAIWSLLVAIGRYLVAIGRYLVAIWALLLTNIVSMIDHLRKGKFKEQEKRKAKVVEATGVAPSEHGRHEATH